MNMRESRVLRQIRSGKVATSIKLNMADPRIAEIAGLCGFDCIWMDMEHVPNDYAVIENCIRAAKLSDADILVRVAKGSYSDFIRPLEMDAAGIMIPHVMSVEEAKRIVYYTKFHPIGRRPIDGGNADTRYAAVPTAEYLKQANEQRFTVIQIEDPEPMEELEQICALEGIDMIFFGPGDFSHGLGVAENPNDERVKEARARVAYTARKHGKLAGTVGSVQNQDELISLGYQFINLGSDLGALISSFKKNAREGSGKDALPNEAFV